MKLHSFIFIFITQLSAVASQSSPSATTRRILHEPLFPAAATPPPDDDVVTQLPPPPPDSSVAADPDQPFFPEIPNGAATQVQNPTLPPPPADASAVIPAATQPAKPVKKVAMVISVGIVTLGMLSALAFYIYRHKAKHPDSQKLMASDSRNYGDESCRDPPSSFFHMGTVDSSANRSEDSAIANTSPYHKLNSVKKLDRYRPSPDLQPLPPLRRQPPHPPARSSPTATVFSSSEDEGSRDANFYTPYGSGAGFDDGFSTPVSKQSRRSKKNSVSNGGGMPFSKVTSSPKSRFSASSPDVVKHAIIPSIKTNPPPPPPPPPPQEPPGLQPLPPEKEIGPLPQIKSVLPTKVKCTTPPSPPNSALLQSISKQSHKTGKAPPPPPPPPPPMSIPPKVRSTWANAPLRPSGSSSKAKLQTSTPEFQKEDLKPEEAKAKPNEDVENGCIYSGRPDGDEMEGTKLKLKPLHWDKVRATSDRATVWDQLKSSSFQLNEDMIESLFGCNSIPNNSSNSANKDATRRSVLPPVEQENRVLDPKKSQNIAILLRALNVTRDEVSQALLEGNPEALGAELLETLVKMAPTKEEEIKLKDYKGDTSKLGSAEKFLIAILDIPFAFKRVEAMLYRANFDAEVKYLRKSFDTLETASDELKKNRLFLKLLEAVLRTGNRMNVGTNRGDAKAFKLDTLLKLVDIKGTDGKTTLLHFVVQEIIKSEDIGSETTTVNFKNQTNSKGLQMVSGLSRELGSVKLAAGMDSDVLHSYVSKLETGLEKVKTVLHLERPDMQGGFFESMRGFLGKAEEEISRIKDDERRVLTVVREVTEYFHGNAAKEEAHPFRIFMIVRDFLTALDQVCKEVGRMHDRTITSARSFRMSTNAPLPVLNRYNVSQDDDWSEDSSSS